MFSVVLSFWWLVFGVVGVRLIFHTGVGWDEQTNQNQNITSTSVGNWNICSKIKSGLTRGINIWNGVWRAWRTRRKLRRWGKGICLLSQIEFWNFMCHDVRKLTSYSSRLKFAMNCQRWVLKNYRSWRKNWAPKCTTKLCLAKGMFKGTASRGRIRIGNLFKSKDSIVMHLCLVLSPPSLFQAKRNVIEETCISSATSATR